MRILFLWAALGVADGATLANLEQMALANHPSIAQVEANVRAAAARSKQAGLYPNPTVGYYADEVRGGYTGGGKQGGFVSQTIVTGGKLRAARRVAELAADETKTAGEMQRLRLLTNVRLTFYETLGAQRMVEVREKLLKLAGDAAQTAHQLANVGQADRPDVLQAEVEQQQAEIGLRTAQQSLRMSWQTLAAAVGRPAMAQDRLDGNLEAFPDLQYDEWLAATLRESPEVKLAEETIARSQAEVAQAEKAPIPDLQLYGNLSQNFEPLETTRRPIGLNGGVQIGVTLPVFNRNQGNIAAAKAQQESAKQDLARVKLRIARNMAALFGQYSMARDTAKQYKAEMLPRAEKAFALYEANYRNMAAAYSQTIFSQRTLFQLEVDYVHALESVWQSSLSIQGFGLSDLPE